MRTAAKGEQSIAEGDGGRLKIGEVSKLSGVGIEALRFYERSGLLGRPARSESGYRMYGEEVLERLSFIKRAQVLGFSLEEIRRIIEEKRAGQNPCAEVREIVRLRLQELDERLKEMRRYRNELAKALAGWDSVGDAPGHVCGLIEGTELGHAMSHGKMMGQKKRVEKRSR
ncbi:MAG TPA: heavy metal-responsive transcriptional regulator [Pyrinomonadaceae bacterium]